MPFRKIVTSDSVKNMNEDTLCLNPEHDPPGNMVFKPGYYEWECPHCGKITKFNVPRITC